MNGAGVWQREKFLLRGRMVEKALQRLKNAGISLYDVKKVQKDAVTFYVTGKDGQKVFAFYPKTWYNKVERGGFELTSFGEKGLRTAIESLWKRVGISIGAAVFVFATAFCDKLVFAVEYSGDSAACAAARTVAKKYGLERFSYSSEATLQKIEAEVFSLDGVSYASVKKSGTVVYVEARRSPFATSALQKGDMLAERAGEIRSVTVLRGTCAVEKGQRVEAGQTLAISKTSSETDGQTTYFETTVCARVVLACSYEAEILAESESEAIAVAVFYLRGISSESANSADALLKSGGDGLAIEKARTQQKEDGAYVVLLDYVFIQTMNF